MCASHCIYPLRPAARGSYCFARGSASQSAKRSGLCDAGTEPIVCLGKFQEALGALQEALRISPEDPVAHNYLGMTYESLQLQQDALAAYKQAIAFKSDYAEAHYNVALVYFTLGDRSQAQHHYEILKTINPDLAEDLLKKLRQ